MSGMTENCTSAFLFMIVALLVCDWLTVSPFSGLQQTTLNVILGWREIY
jgi:hypothetical protein